MFLTQQKIYNRVMAKTRLFITTILFWVIAISSCKKDDIKCTDDKEFCDFIDKEEYNNIGSLIDKYLVGQRPDINEGEKLEQLLVWLNCKSCVSRSELLCNSCIYTNPPQSEIKVWFTVNGKEVIKVLDVTMDEPLRFSNFHD
jgi:hypothetical protein